MASLTPRRAPSARHMPLPSPTTSQRSSTGASSTGPIDTWSSPALPSSSSSGSKTSYTSFTRTSKPKRKSDASMSTSFAVGSTVLVSVLSGGASGGGLPAVGVVVEMWERGGDEDDEEGDGGEGIEEEIGEGEGEGMWVRVKWFQRVRECPRMMQTRLGGLSDPLKLYYTSTASSSFTSFSPPIPTSSLLSSCVILASQPAHAKASKVDPATGRKYSGWAYITEEADSSSDEETNDDVPSGSTSRALKIEASKDLGSFQFGRLEVPRTYWCAGVCDSRSGEVWEWEELGFAEKGWEAFRENAMARKTEGLEGWVTKRPSRKKKKKVEEVKVKDKGKGKEKIVPKASHKAKPRSTSPSKPSTASSPTKRRRSRYGTPVSSSSSQSDTDDEASDAHISSGSSSSGGSGSESSSESEEEADSGDDEPRRRGGKGAKVRKTQTKASIATERRLAKKKLAQDKKIKSTIKRLRAPKARPLLDLVEGKLPQDPYARAMHLLHVGATPDTLPCREEQYADVLVKIEGVIEGGGGGCIYISGQPGTGKTATVHAVVRELRQKAQDLEIPPFEYVEINGLKIPDPGHAYVVLWEAICGGSLAGDEVEDPAVDGSAGGAAKKVSSKTALRGLESHFSGRGGGAGGARNCTYVVLMDELDQLFTAKQDVVYNFFNWPTIPGSQLVVIAVANTMDMPEKLAGRVKSRMGMERINFPPYTKDQLVEIAQSRLIPHPAPDGPSGQADHQVIENEALMLAAARTTGVTGDARRMLDVCRRAVEVALIPPPTPPTTPINPSPAKGKQRANGVLAAWAPQPVKTKQILAVLVEMSKNPTAQFVRNCTLYEKVMLAAVVRGVRKAGVGEVEWGKIKSDHSLLLSTLTLLPASQTRLLPTEYLSILSSLASSYALSVASGPNAIIEEQRKVGMGSGMDESEVGRVLRDLKGETGGERWRGMFE